MGKFVCLPQTHAQSTLEIRKFVCSPQTYASNVFWKTCVEHNSGTDTILAELRPVAARAQPLQIKQY